MNAKWIILVFLLGLVPALGAQSMIGLGKEEVRVIVERDMKDFRIDKTIVKQQFNYLKYVNALQSKTLIIFFSDEDICTKTKLICDYSEYDSMLEELNKKYERTGDASWVYSYDDSTYLITLEKQEWYFVLREIKEET